MRGYDPIYQLYCGNLRPCDHGFRKDCTYALAVEALAKHEAWFNEQLTGTDKKRFEELMACHNDIVDRMAFQNFKLGFQLGAMLTMEAVHEDTSTFYDL